MSDYTVVGRPGANGSNGTPPGGTGAPGKPGQSVTANRLSFDADNFVLALGGRGGNGGYGADPLGMPGPGGPGGAALARLITQAPADIASNSLVEAHGGDGGNAGSTAAGGPGVNGPSGGWANAQGSTTAIDNADIAIRAVAIGGAGGRGDKGQWDPRTFASGTGGSAYAVASGRSSGSGTVTVEADQTGGHGGFGWAASNGGAGAASTMNNQVKGWTNGGTLHLIQSSTGGSGGDSFWSKPGVGGAATAALVFDDTVNFTRSKFLVAESTARGGNGGSAQSLSDFGRNGADGGIATAKQVIKSSGSIDVVSTAIGGGGGAGISEINSDPSAFHGGRGGKALATARGVSTEDGTVDVTAVQHGGNGGSANWVFDDRTESFIVASPGAGADSTMINAVSGMTNGGKLNLHETAVGGEGGGSSSPFAGPSGTNGGGGGAEGTLHFNDLLNATQSKAVDASVTAVGGNGGSGFIFVGGTGGNATASDTIVAKYHAGAIAEAIGGDSGFSFGLFGAEFGHNGGGGDAAATAVALATDASRGDVFASAGAHGGLGIVALHNVGSAVAKATGTGHSGSVHANADTHGDGNVGDFNNPQLTTFRAAGADAIVAGQSTAQAQVSVGGNAPDHLVGPQAFALLVGDPSSPSQNAELADNPNIRSYFHDDAFYFASGELGAASSTGSATAAYTQTSHIALDINTFAFGTPSGNLILGFYDATVTGGASGPVNLNVMDNGVSLLHSSFADTTQAASYLQDHPLDLGSLSTQQTHNLDVTLSVTTNPGQHAGLYVDLVLGSGLLLA